MTPPDGWHTLLGAAARGDAAWRQVRDLSVLAVAPGMLLVVACDSVGGIGPKPHDTYPASAYEVGRFAARVPLSEIVACGATPLLLTNTLAVERTPTGDAILAGIDDEMRDAGMNPATMLTGSTEENVVTAATGVGITVLGIVAAGNFRPGRATAGDLVACIGTPKSAPYHVLLSNDPSLLTPRLLRRLQEITGVGDILPVGSRGVAAEAHDLAHTANLQFTPAATTTIDLVASGGPATCCIAVLASDVLPHLRAMPDFPPIAIIGTLT